MNNNTKPRPEFHRKKSEALEQNQQKKASLGEPKKAKTGETSFQPRQVENKHSPQSKPDEKTPKL